MRYLSYSEIRSWTTCRMQWYFAHQLRLARRVSRPKPQLGTCCHIGIAAHLQQQDWVAAMDEWYGTQLSNLFDEEIVELDRILEDSKVIVGRYIKKYASDESTYKVLAVEQKFKIPMSGSIMGEPICLVGTWDGIVENRENGSVWLLEHKFPGQLRSEDSLLLDAQIGIYQFAANKKGLPVVGTIFDQALGKAPVQPARLKDGSFNRARVSTDWETYRSCLVEAGYNPADYAEMEAKLDVEFYRRTLIYRPPVEQKIFAEELKRRIWAMNNKHIFRTESIFNCGACSYRELCIESLKGRDITDIVEHEFVVKEERYHDEDDYYSASPSCPAN